MAAHTTTLVAGASGAGKTTWIRQQIESIDTPAIYLNLGLGYPSVDSTYLAAEVPNVRILPVMELTNFLENSENPYPVYVELGFHIDAQSLVLPNQIADCERVAIVPAAASHTEWHDWADRVLTSGGAHFTPEQPHLWRSTFAGQVLDLASLNTFCYELTHGAYGTVQRAKGIFDVADGRSLYFDFVAGLSEATYLDLNLPPWLSGKPDRFSGLEVVGEALDQEAMAQTIKDCCLDDQAIAYYQHQIQTLLNAEEEV